MTQHQGRVLVRTTRVDQDPSVMGIRHEFVTGVDIFSCSFDEILPTPNDLSVQSIPIETPCFGISVARGMMRFPFLGRDVSPESTFFAA